jgi:hypothetical protein
MYKFLISIAFISIFTACTTQATMNSLNGEYKGKHIDKFIINNGVPYKKYRLNSGGYVYKWSSSVKSFSMPTTTTYNGNASAYGYGNSAYGSYSGNAVTYGGGSISLGCVLQLYTNSREKIISITALDDTVGIWKASRCAEVVH